MRFANDLLNKADRFEESVPVWFAAASLFKKKGDLWMMSYCVGGGDVLRRRRYLQAMPWCVSDGGWRGMHEANKRMIERDVTMKDVVKRHVIPLMHDIKNQMLEVTSVSEEVKCI